VAGEELPAAGARQTKDVLHVRNRAAHRPEDGGRQRSASGREEKKARDAACRLEAARSDVLMRQRVSGGVRGQSEEERPEARACGGSRQPAGGDMQGDDHARRRVNDSMKDCDWALV
jgi:hypothetical protein